MAIYKCKMCGGDLNITEGTTVAECEYCGTQQTLPKANNEVLQNLFNRANNLRIKSEFDKAEQVYEKILQEDDTDPEAHWGVVLCKYGIEYVEDPKTYKRIPTCHRTSYDAVTTDADYLAAVEHADASQRAIYEAEAKVIDETQKGILSIVKNEKPFDVFICYKETDETGKRTVDSTIANDIYHQLTQEGLKVFYAAITLEDKLGQEYEPYIFAALNSAKVMLVIGTKPQYFSAVWVKNEWSRFLKLMKADRSKLLIPCYRDMDAYDLPEEFSHLQAQDMSKIGFINDVVRGIKKVTVSDEPKQTVVKETVVTSANSNTAPLLERAFMFLEDGDWSSANEYCEKVLDIDPKNAQAYLGKLMAELKVRKRESLKDQAEPFDGYNNYQKAVRFADEALNAELTGFITYINERNETARLNGIYNKAKNAMAAANTENAYKEAASVFDSISEYQDSAKLAAECREKAEIARKEAERIAKRNKKIAMIAGAAVCAVIAIIILINSVILPAVNYSKAITLMEAEQYEEAIAAFQALNGYKDSNTQIRDCQYNNAVALMEAEQYIEAYEALIALDGYKDSADKASNIFSKYFAEKNRNIKVGGYIKFGTYEQDNIDSNGQEEIEWLVLEKQDNKILVISRYALDRKPYNTSYTDVTWETCTLRKWLNNDFINAAFSADEKAMVPTVTVSADKNPDYSTNPGNATQDQVFLLSITEANKYFSSDSARQCEPTDFAVANGAWESNNGNCWWWLRSPGDSQDDTARVGYDGGVVEHGVRVYFSNTAVRPALWIDLNS